MYSWWAGSYWAETYWADTFWTVYALTQTPFCRTFPIEFENRTFEVITEDRTFPIEFENRTFEVTKCR